MIRSLFQRLLPAMLLLTLCFAAMPLMAQADTFDPLGSVDCNTAEQRLSAVCNDKDPGHDPLSGKDGLLLKITDIIAYIAGAAAVIVIIVSAIRFATSGSDISTSARHDNDVEEARRTLVYAIIGLFVIVLARALITFVIRKL